MPRVSSEISTQNEFLIVSYVCVKSIDKYLTNRRLYDMGICNMEIYNRAAVQSPESATEWLLKLIVWEFFGTADLGFASA